jgi:3-phytase
VLGGHRSRTRTLAACLVVAVVAASFPAMLALAHEAATVSVKRLEKEGDEIIVEESSESEEEDEEEAEEEGNAEPSFSGGIVWTLETGAVAGSGDVADDPAIWVNRQDPSQSLVIGTDKDSSSGGVYVYGLDGTERQRLATGETNNADVRYDFKLGATTTDIVASTNRTTDSIDFFRVDAARGRLEPVGSVSTGVTVYGVCLYRSAQSGKLYAFATDRRSGVEQYEITGAADAISGKLVRTLDTQSTTEGCVADDELGHLYIGEERRGVWKYGAEPDAGQAHTAMDSVGSGRLEADVEGIAIYDAGRGGGYVLVSSQGSSSFAVYERGGDNAYVGSFEIAGPDGDDVTDTDGIDVTSAALGSGFSSGLLVVHDASNDAATSNFKFVSWDLVAQELGAQERTLVPGPGPSEPQPEPSAPPQPAPDEPPTGPAQPPTDQGPCRGTQVSPSEDLPALVNGTSGETFCLAPGTYDIGSESIEPGSGTEIIGAPVGITDPGAVNAPTKIVGSSPDGVFFFSRPATGVVIANLDICCSPGSDRKQGRGINGNSGRAVGLVVRDSRIHGNAMSGIGGIGDDALIERVELDNNGSEAFIGCCSAGIKSADFYTIRNSYVHDNTGNGIWVDSGGSFVVTDNVVTDNTRNGIRYENSTGFATILRNVVQRNSTSQQRPGGGIEINSADDAEIADNVLGDNFNAGIIFRGSRSPVGGAVRGNVLNGDVIKGCDGPSGTCSG